jgi:enamine deaminase RidA (YjgF/YER057c/UK114 family)
MPDAKALASKEVICPGGLPQPIGYSHAIKAGDFLFLSGLMATDFKSGIAPEARVKPGRPLDLRPVKQQTRYIYKTLQQILQVAGSSLEHLVRLDQFTLNREAANDYLEGRNEFLLKDRPASTLVPVAGLLLPEAGIEVDATSIIPRPGLAKSVARSDKIAFNVGGGYSQTVIAGDFAFLAGCTTSDHIGAAAYPGGKGTGLHPDARVNPNYWYGSKIKAQTRYIVEQKLNAMLEVAGCSLDNVVRAQVYILDMAANWAGFQEVWAKLFPRKRPSLTVYPVNAFGTVDALIEISFIALKPGSSLPVQSIETQQAAPPLGPCPQAVKVGPYVFLSTILAADENGIAPEAAVDRNFPWHSIPAKRQMTHMLRSIEAICHASGGDLDSVVKRYAMHTRPEEFAPAMEVWREAFAKSPPASTTVIVDAPLPVPACTMALDLIGYVPG